MLNQQHKKFLKKLLKLTIYCLACILLIPLITFGLFQNQYIQNYLTKVIVKNITPNSNYLISFSKVNYRLIDQFVFNDILIYNRVQNDTLFSASKITIKLHHINFKTHYLLFRRVLVQDPYLNIKKENNGKFNIQSFINSFKDSTSTTHIDWIYKIQNIECENAKVLYDANSEQSPLFFENVILRLKNFTISQNNISFKINRLKFLLNKKFQLENLSSVFSLNDSTIIMDKLNLVTPFSDIHLNKFIMRLSSKEKHKNYISFILNISTLNTKDIKYLINVNNLPDITYTLKAEGKGYLNDFKIKQFSIKSNEGSIVKGQFYYTKTDKNEEPYLYFDTKLCHIRTKELNEYFKIFNTNQQPLPNSISKLEYIEYKGNFTGFLSDFVSTGTIYSPIGNIKIDLSIQPKTKKEIEFNGTIETLNLILGHFIDNSLLIGKTNLKLRAYGQIANDNIINAQIDCDVYNTSLNQYTLENFSAKGQITKNIFQGTTNINDPNIQLKATGIFNFSSLYPEFNFNAEIYKINLIALNFLPKDSINHFAAQISANFKGNKINQLDGNIDFKNIIIKNYHTSAHINHFLITLINNEIIQSTTIRSDILDLDIKGKYNYKSLPSELLTDIRKLLDKTYIDSNYVYQNNIDFKLHIKKLNPLLAVLIPKFKIADNTLIEGSYSNFKKNNYAILKSDYVIYKNFEFDNIYFEIANNDSNIHGNFFSKNFFIGNHIHLQQFSTGITVAKSQAEIINKWTDSLKHENEIKFILSDMYNLDKNIRHLVFTIYPTSIYIFKDKWVIKESNVIVDSNAFIFDSVQIIRHTKQLMINGKISQLPEDQLQIKFEQVDLSFINKLINKEDIYFEGTTNGILKIQNIYGIPQLIANVNIDKFKINDVEIGQGQIIATWDNQDKLMHLQLTDKPLNKLSIKAKYIPLNDFITIELTSNQLGLKLIEPLLSPTFEVPEGNFSGKLDVETNLKKIVLNGKFLIEYGKIHFPLFNSNYKIKSSELIIKNNTFYFNNFNLYDEYNTPLFLKGTLTNQNLKNFSIDFQIEANNNLIFNRRTIDDLPFYGIAYASGKIHIYGPTNQIKIDATQTKTEENTNIFIVIDNLSSSVSSDFITFTSQSIQSNPINNRKRNNFFNQKAKILFNIDLDVTTDANVQLTLNSLTGDKIKGRGTGSLKFSNDLTNKISIIGQYSITEGEYTFTINNLINKKFLIQNNSMVFFNGEPNEAVLDILAIYNTRAPLLNLLGEDNIEYKKRIPVECQLMLKGQLLEPNIKLAIELPNSSEETKSRVRSFLNNEQEITQQFLALLLLNNFLPPAGIGFQNKVQETNIGRDAATTTSLELLTSQLSSWLSSINKDLNVGISYRPGDQAYSTEELEIALSTQLLNERMIINSNIDFIGNYPNANNKNQTTNLIGDINIEYRLTDRLSFKVFNRSNDVFYFQDELYTRGIGIIYREDFTNVQDLTQRYFGKKDTKRNQKDIILTQP